MSTSQCVVYQVKDTPEYRDVRFRSYEKLKSEGKTVQVENYHQVYIGRIQPGKLRLISNSVCRSSDRRTSKVIPSAAVMLSSLPMMEEPQLTMSTKMVSLSFRIFTQSKVPPTPDFPLIQPAMKLKGRKEHGLHRITS